MSVVIANTELGDVRVEGGVVAAIGRVRPGPGDDVIDGRGGALIPGLHDRHIHLGALAAAAGSTPVGPPHVTDRAALGHALQGAPGEWVRAVGYHESVAGPLDAAALDALVPDRPVRVQHRTGKLWTLNSEALRRVGAAGAREPGIERDANGRTTGRLWRMDSWLRGRVPATCVDLAPVGRAAAAAGVVAFTDADPTRQPGDVDRLSSLPQRVEVMGPLGLRVPGGARLTLGPVKVHLDDEHLPDLDDLVALMTAAHDEGRNVAVHCVTRVQLILALAGWEQAGTRPGDRIEHGSVIPPEVFPAIVRLGLHVVTQPGFVAERGATYGREVDPDDLPHLYRCRSLIDAGIPVALSTDAPYTNADPWAAIRAAADRTLNPGERIDAHTGLRLFAATPAVVVGGPADLCLLQAPLADVLAAPSAGAVRATIAGGVVIHEAC